ncbi:RYamide receptor-like [Homalodisca vitripennis]|uniref:RYamide receptor-like n=2 Tax=Homalodisca vitripennis TaxID=197043 RepID=UPI001EEA1520|nr:RYamide receptor-like [Homalodisca vitripennis]
MHVLLDLDHQSSLNTTNTSLDVDYPSLEAVDVPFQVTLVTLFSLTACLSLGGNLTVIAILTFGKRSSGDLRAFLINLAVSDVTMAVFSIPFTYTLFMLGRWIFPPWFCPIAMAMQHTSVIVSVYTLMAIGIDRYRAIWYPFERHSRNLRNKVVILGIWLMAGLVSAIQLKVVEAYQFKYDGRWHYDCAERWLEPQHGRMYTVFIFLFTFVIPLFGMALTYSSIAWKMWRRSSPGNADPDRDLVQLRAKRKVIKMLVTIVVLFSFCWLPLQIFNAVYNFFPAFANTTTDTSRTLYALSYFGCLWLANANSFVNPLIYCFMSENFRADLRDLFWRVWRRENNRQHHGGSLRSSTRTTISLAHHSDYPRSFRRSKYERSFKSTSFEKHPDNRKYNAVHSYL